MSRASLTVKQSSQYRVLVQIELEKCVGSFHTLVFGKADRLPVPVTKVSLIFFTTEIPASKQGSRSHFGRLSEPSLQADQAKRYQC